MGWGLLGQAEVESQEPCFCLRLLPSPRVGEGFRGGVKAHLPAAFSMIPVDNSSVPLLGEEARLPFGLCPELAAQLLSSYLHALGLSFLRPG